MHVIQMQNVYQIAVKYCVQYPVRANHAMVIFPPVMVANVMYE